MKRSVKAKTKRETARDPFTEVNEGIKAITELRLGKRMLPTHVVDFTQTLKVRQHGDVSHYLGDGKDPIRLS